MVGISLITEIDVNLIAFMEEKRKDKEYLYKRFKNDKEIKAYLNTFYISEMDKRKWLLLRHKDSVVQNYVDLKQFLGVRNVDNYKSLLQKRYVFKKNDESINIKIGLWIAHCNHLISGMEVIDYDSSKLPDLLDELKIERLKKFDKNRLVELFKKYGIILVIEETLSGTKVRGCCKVKIKTPVIYMSTLYKNKASFYFTLYHEIGHIKRDYNLLKNKVMVEDDEKFCDDYSLNQMIPNDVWQELKTMPSNYNEICIKNSIPLSFYYSRLAYEKIISYRSREYNEHMEKIEL